MNVSVSLSGDAALRGKLNRMSQAARGQAMLRAVKAGAMPIENDAKGRAPVDTSTLRRSIHVGAEQVGAYQVSVEIGSDVSYAIFVEKGTSKMAAQPYLRPALESGRGAAETEIEGALRVLIMGAVG